MNSTVSIWYRQLWKDKLAAGFTNSFDPNDDRVNTLIQLILFAGQHGMHWIGLDLLPNNDTSNGSIEDLYRVGSWIGAIGQSNGSLGLDLLPPRIDLLTAEHLGRRVALATQRWVRGNSVPTNFSFNQG
jgi:multimeric flavodoxin WrbA